MEGHGPWLDAQLTRNVAALLSQGLVSMNRVAHDGKRVRAHAGAASFRRRDTLQQRICPGFPTFLELPR